MNSLTVEDFEVLRPRLFGIAYRMLGSAMEAEDILQETYLRVFKPNAEQFIQSAKAYLTRIVTNLCLDRLKSARHQRESYIGYWLPEPILTEDDALEQRETLTIAFLLLLDHLSPPERAVFLLHEVFDYSYSEIAGIMEKTPAACRQLMHRARARINTEPPAVDVLDPHGAKLLDQLLHALGAGDMAQVMMLMTEDVVSITDGGGKVTAATRPVTGADHVARFFNGLEKQAGPQIRYSMPVINGVQSVIVWDGDKPVYVLIPEWRNGKLYRSYLIGNPDKLNLRSLPQKV